jgi:murein DD-endopeptidase MepM/ murein hydrolase activator NlpD
MHLSKIIIVCLAVLLLTVPTIAQDDIDATEQAQPRPMPTTVRVEGDLVLEFYFPSVIQGGVGLVRLAGDNINQARAFFIDKEYPFFQIADDGWYAFAVANMDVQPRNYELTVLVERTDGNVTFNEMITVESAGYITQNFDIPGDRGYLADPEIERAEFAKLDAITTGVTLDTLWRETGFDLPLDAEITSSFGTYRVLNQAMQTRHTGRDQRAPVGTPIQAIGAGKIAFAGQLDIRGNYIMIDHGYGVYSGYAHFSQIHVTRGQTITEGQVIGMSGNTGRSSGPHLHWEMIVNGEWVDSLAFIEMWMPS